MTEDYTPVEIHACDSPLCPYVKVELKKSVVQSIVTVVAIALTFYAISRLVSK